MPELKGYIPPTVNQTVNQSDSNKQGRTLIVLVLVLLGLLLVYLMLMRPPQIISAPSARGVTNVFSIYGVDRKDLLKEPNGVFINANGDIYVADTGNDRIVIFDSQGRFKSKIAYKQNKEKNSLMKRGDLIEPLGVAVDSRGRVVATGFDTGIMFFSPKGQKVRQMPIPAIQPYVKGDKLYVTTPASIYVINSRGDLVQHIGSKGRRLGQFVAPNDVILDKKGNLIVSDSQNMRLQMLNKKGDVIGYKGAPPKRMGDNNGRLFGLGTGITIDDQGRIYVADALSHDIRIFDKDGNDLGELGDMGSADGLFNNPTDIVYMGGNTFAVADKWNDRVQILRLNVGEARAAGAAPQPANQGLRGWLPYIGLLVLLAIIIFIVRRRLTARSRYRRALAG